MALVVTNYLPTVGGAEKQAHSLAQHMSRTYGIHYTVVTRKPPGTSWTQTIGDTEVLRLPAPPFGRAVRSSCYIAGGALVLAAGGFDVFHCVQSFSPLTLAALASRVRPTKTIVKITASGLLGEARELQKLPLLNLRKRLMQQVSQFVVLTEEMRREWAEFGIPPERICKIPNGVRLPAQPFENRIDAKARLGTQSPFVVTFTGRLSSEKNLITLLRAWVTVVAAVPDARLFLVGPKDAYRDVSESLLRFVRDEALEGSVVFVGATDRVDPYLAASDAFVLPSLTEGMSNALLEAMSYGLPVVVSDIPANLEVVRPGESGLAFSCPDASQLAAQLLWLYRNPSQARLIGDRARGHIEAEFSLDAVGKKYWQLYHQG